MMFSDSEADAGTDYPDAHNPLRGWIANPDNIGPADHEYSLDTLFQALDLVTENLQSEHQIERLPIERHHLQQLSDSNIDFIQNALALRQSGYSYVRNLFAVFNLQFHTRHEQVSKAIARLKGLVSPDWLAPAILMVAEVCVAQDKKSDALCREEEAHVEARRVDRLRGGKWVKKFGGLIGQLGDCLRELEEQPIPETQEALAQTGLSAGLDKVSVVLTSWDEGCLDDPAAMHRVLFSGEPDRLNDFSPNERRALLALTEILQQNGRSRRSAAKAIVLLSRDLEGKLQYSEKGLDDEIESMSHNLGNWSRSGKKDGKMN
jgi:hypothetical protein